MVKEHTTDELAARVDGALEQIVRSRDMELYRMMSHHMGWEDRESGVPAPSAHRGRGVLCLLACEASGGETDRALPAAAAVELVHNFTLIHDDVQGGQPSRNDRDAVWWVWGPAQAINAGDGMYALARLALFQLMDRGVDAPTTFRAVQFLDEASLKTCEGRFLDLEAQERIDLSLDGYLTMASAKTGALMACAMKLGGLLAGADAPALEALAACGNDLGVSLQMRDDVRELWATGTETPSSELMNKKKLLPVVLALESASVSDKRRLGDIYFKRVLDPNDIVSLRETLEELGIRDECNRLLEDSRERALAALDRLSEDGRTRVAELAETLLA